MKKLLIILFIGTTLMTYGQHESKQRKMTEDFSPEQKAILKTKKMTLAYDLTKTQQEQMLNLNKKWAKELDVKKKEMTSENKAEMTSTERFNHINAMLDSKISHQNDVKAVLNKEQFEQWKKTSSKMNKKGKGRSEQQRKNHGHKEK